MKNRILLLFFFCFYLNAFFSIQGQAQNMTILPTENQTLLYENWIARQASYVIADGADLSSGNYDFKNWMPASVPGTVLTTLINNGLLPSPYYGMNNDQIPDIHEVGNIFYTYWFVNRFQLSHIRAGQQLWLNFRGINYRAEIFLNGKRISTTTHEGMFIRQSYNITEEAKSDSVNILAVIVYPPDHPGEANGGQGGDGMIARNLTMQCTPGWDWIQAVRDRNTGIWDHVSITTTGNVRLQYPQIITKLPGVRVPEGKQEDAILSLSVEAENLTNVGQKTIIEYELEGIKINTQVNLNPLEKKMVRLPDAKIKNPRLWWPNGMGKPELYSLTLSAKDEQGQPSDQQDIRFGIREVRTEKDLVTGGRKFFVNGQKIFIRGGNYIASDWMLQLSPERYRTEVQFHADMNLNMIRVWGGAIPERPEFYDACDELGMLVFQDFSISGDGNGAWDDPAKKESKERRRAYPDNHSLFLLSIIDQVRMLRNHPSLCLWCGGNEWPAPADIDQALKDSIMPHYDPTRYFTSYSTDTLFTRNTIGGVGDGPYGIQEPEWFFTFRSTPFNPELGSVGVPESAAMRAIMDEKDFNDFPRVSENGRPYVNQVWNYHKYIGYGDHIERYGKPTTGDGFCDIAQLINYDQYRGLMEGWASNMWNWYTGMLIWKTQNPWSALRGQMYDCYLDVNACYYGTRKGGEPLHVQYNLKTKQVEVINTTTATRENLKLKIRMYGLDGKMLSERSEAVQARANSAQSITVIEHPQNITGVYFLRLELSDGKNTLSENIYWLTTQTKDYTSMATMLRSQDQVTTNVQQSGMTNFQATVNIKSGHTMSFFNRVSVFNKKTGERILPVFYSDNYVTLFPNEEKSIQMTFNTNVPKDDIRIVVRTMNK